MSHFDAREGENSIQIGANRKLYVGEVIGETNEDDIRRIQIRETIASHLQKKNAFTNEVSRCYPFSSSMKLPSISAMMSKMMPTMAPMPRCLKKSMKPRSRLYWLIPTSMEVTFGIISTSTKKAILFMQVISLSIR